VNDLELARWHEVPNPPLVLLLTIEWSFMQNQLSNIIHDNDRLEVASGNESDGGEECEAILTALRRAKRREARRRAKRLEQVEPGKITENDGETVMSGGKPLPNLKLTLNGH
jgi:hypothetical protein